MDGEHRAIDGIWDESRDEVLDLFHNSLRLLDVGVGHDPEILNESLFFVESCIDEFLYHIQNLYPGKHIEVEDVNFCEEMLQPILTEKAVVILNRINEEPTQYGSNEEAMQWEISSEPESLNISYQQLRHDVVKSQINFRKRCHDLPDDPQQRKKFCRDLSVTVMKLKKQKDETIKKLLKRKLRFQQNTEEDEDALQRKKICIDLSDTVTEPKIQSDETTEDSIKNSPERSKSIDQETTENAEVIPNCTSTTDDASISSLTLGDFFNKTKNSNQLINTYWELSPELQSKIATKIESKVRLMVQSKYLAKCELLSEEKINAKVKSIVDNLLT